MRRGKKRLLAKGRIVAAAIVSSHPGFLFSLSRLLPDFSHRTHGPQGSKCNRATRRATIHSRHFLILSTPVEKEQRHDAGREDGKRTRDRQSRDDGEDGKFVLAPAKSCQGGPKVRCKSVKPSNWGKMQQKRA